MGKEDEPFDPLKVRVNPFVEALMEVLEEQWDRQLEDLKEKGMLPKRGIIFDDEFKNLSSYDKGGHKERSRANDTGQHDKHWG